jgi:superoxide dismutase, Cu-Zn family
MEFSLINNNNTVQVQANIRGLSPGSHGFHIHSILNLTDPTCLATGGHFNPLGRGHTCSAATGHMGDLGNLVADANGFAVYSNQFNAADLQLNLIVNKPVIIHANVDDCTTQPTGNSGARQAVCEIVSSTSFTDSFAPTTLAPTTLMPSMAPSTINPTMVISMSSPAARANFVVFLICGFFLYFINF